MPTDCHRFTENYICWCVQFHSLLCFLHSHHPSTIWYFRHSDCLLSRCFVTELNQSKLRLVIGRHIEEVGEAALQIEDWLESRGYWHPSEEARRVRDEFRRKHHGHHHRSRDSDRDSRRESRSSRGGHHR
mmetsp:Transcript_3195/g.2688  ORF Transcript_3195/g.2688 Transcript_3195/m.2688 type:complete len:130 (+) Transcript_3195:95-484(+)